MNFCFVFYDIFNFMTNYHIGPIKTTWTILNTFVCSRVTTRIKSFLTNIANDQCFKLLLLRHRHFTR